MLTISGCNFTLPDIASSAKTLMNSMGSYIGLKILVLRRLKLSAALIDVFAQASSKNHQLAELHLLRHDFSDGTPALCRFLETNTTLKVLTLKSSSPADEQSKALLHEALARNKSLEEIRLSLNIERS